MARPSCKMESSTDPWVSRCVAQWNVLGKDSATVEFISTTQFFVVDALIQAAYDMGQRDGVASFDAALEAARNNFKKNF